MPTHRVSPDCELHYVMDDYAAPWRGRETILTLPGNSYHVAASGADRCARATRVFIARVASPGGQGAAGA